MRLFLLIILLPSISLAGNAGKDCGLHKKNPFEGMSYIQEIICKNAISSGVKENIKAACKNTNVAWYQDRDNSMSDIDVNADTADATVGRAMGIVFSKAGKSQAVQVCPGVYLATAHGVLDNPIKLEEENKKRIKAKMKPRKLRRPDENFFSIGTYPLDRKQLMKASSKKSFISPRLNNPSNWKKPNTDYVFIKVTQPLRPESFIAPIDANDDEIVSASKSGNNVHLYRGKTRYQTDAVGNPSFDDDDIKSTFADLQKTYDKPQKVNRKCDLATNINQGLTVSNCPVERFVSGSPMVVFKNNTPYLVGTHNRGNRIKISNFNDGKDSGSIFLNSSEFCSDYEKACGQKCPPAATLSQQSSLNI